MKILQLELLANDLAAIETFYTGTLGLAYSHKDQDTIRYDIGRTQLSFRLTETLQPVYHIAFDIPNNQLAAAIAWLEGKAALLPAADGDVIVDFPAWNAKSVYCYDHNANILEFIARFDSANTHAGHFDAGCLLHISEIGLATADVAALAAQLIDNYSIDYYEKQPPLPNFCALGDLEGLLIISKDDRNWYPTDRPANKYPLKLKIETAAGVQELNYQ